MSLETPGFSVVFSCDGQPLEADSLPPHWQKHDNLTLARYCGKGCGVAQNEHLRVLLFGTPLFENRLNQDINQIARQLLEQQPKSVGQLLEKLSGNFCVVLVDIANRSIQAAVDLMGRQSLYIRQLGSKLQLATSASLLLDAINRHTNISHQGIFNYTFFHMIPATGSIYENVSKLQAAHQLEFRQGRLSSKRYWTPQFSESAIDEKQAHQQLLEKIHSAIAQYSGQERTGAFLSGGLDSSTVSGVLAQQVERPPTFSIGFDAEGYDEIAYARIASQHFNTEQHEYYVTPDDVLDTVPKIAAFYDEPFGNSSALPAYFCARLARQHNIDCLLAGDGGDELFAGNERYAKQGVFEIYQKMPAVLRKGLAEPLAGLLPVSVPLIGKIKSYIQQAAVTLPDRLNTYNFLRRHAAAEIFTGDFLSDVDIEQPLAIQQALYETPDNASTLNRMLYLDWQLTLADNDLQKVNKMCQMADMQVVYPLLDDELVKFSCQIPSEQKLKGNQLRYFYKQAMLDFLPHEIINKSKHGFGLPFGVWMEHDQRLQALAYDNLLQLKSFNYFNPEFIDRTIDMHRNVHASFYGELVWILMMLSLWLQQH
ncbi:MAG: asparagine synthase-related protein [Chromatiales bacterium]|jgi:asparagine synthase (glutamine-hydrolysing)